MPTWAAASSRHRRASAGTSGRRRASAASGSSPASVPGVGAGDRGGCGRRRARSCWGSSAAARSSSSAGLLDDAYTLRPLAKLAAQFAAAGVVLASGLSVEIVGNDVLALAIGLALAGRDHERVQPARQHGRPRGLAGRRLVRRTSPSTRSRSRTRTSSCSSLALALGCACVGFLPVQPARRAARPPSSWATPGARCSASRSPRSRSPRAGRPPARRSPTCCCRCSCSRCRSSTRRSSRSGARASGGRSPRADATTPRTGSSTTGSPSARRWRCWPLLAAAARARPASPTTSSTTARVTTFGVLVTFVLLVQFASFLGDLEERSRRADAGPAALAPAGARLAAAAPRRGARRLRAHLRLLPRRVPALRRRPRHRGQRAIFLARAAGVLGVRYVAFVLGRDLPPRLALRRRRATPSRSRSRGPLGARRASRSSRAAPAPWRVPARDLPPRRAALHVARRRLAPGVTRWRRTWCAAAAAAGRARRVLIVGAGRVGPQPRPGAPRDAAARAWSASSTTTRSVRRRRVLGVKVLGGLDETRRA